MSKRGWIGFDLDGTLATYEGWKGHSHIGAPIPLMVERAQAYLLAGVELRVFTARAAAKGQELEDVRSAVAAWTLEHLGVALPITNIKDYEMVRIYDDRAVQAEFNTGRVFNAIV